jgi:hypothetical protein
MKKTKKKTAAEWEKDYEELKKATTALAKCALLTLQSNGKVGVGSGMVIDLKTKKVEHWSTQFFDALDMVGLTYDRTKFFEKKGKRR